MSTNTQAIAELTVNSRQHLNWLTASVNKDIDRIAVVKSLSPLAKQVVINRLKYYYFQQLTELEAQLERDIAYTTKQNEMEQSFICSTAVTLPLTGPAAVPTLTASAHPP
jgi:hypothetical protein